MTKIIILVLFCFVTNAANSQEKVKYMHKTGKMEFTISDREFYVEFKDNDAKKVEGISKSFARFNSTSAIVEIEELSGKYVDRKSQLKKKIPQVTKIEPILVYRDGTKQIAIGEINLKIKVGQSIREIAKNFNVKIAKSSISSNFFTLSNSSISTEELFKLVDELQADKRVEFAEPNFIRELKFLTSDPFFSSQWAIKNQGYLGGTPGADMKVEQAWNYATGSGIKVAILDEGVDLTHPDLQANLLTGFDATGNNSNGAPQVNDPHGTACAGIVAAVANNNIGITGVAYNAKILPIRIGRTVAGSFLAWTTDSWAANGINWAWQNGADVLSNSWTFGNYSSTVATAITNAVANGRNGKGCVVLFATGNTGDPVSFPASLDNVIAVGASSMCEERKSSTSCDNEQGWGSNYGSGLDIVAPGVKIYTTDIQGNGGYNSSDYRADFNGTSAATPNAAGVVALILSVNPNLTGSQARYLLETTCDKVGGYNYQSNVSGQPNGTWNNEVGYGRINANKAICAANNFGLPLNGDATVCATSNSYTIPNLTSGAIVQWDAFPLGVVTINSPNSPQTTITKITDGIVTLTATITNSNACVGVNTSFSKTISVGSPKLINLSTGSEAFNLVGQNFNYGANGPGNSFSVCPSENISLTPFVPSDYNPSINAHSWTISGSYSSVGFLDQANLSVTSSSSTYNNFSFTYQYLNSCGWSPIHYGTATTIDCAGGEEPFREKFEKGVVEVDSSYINSVSIYPNPVKEKLIISLDKRMEGVKVIRLVDANGRAISSQQITGYTTTISFAGLVNGMYYIEINQGKRRVIKKVIK